MRWPCEVGESLGKGWEYSSAKGWVASQANAAEPLEPHAIEMNGRLNHEVLERRELLALIESPAITPPTQPPPKPDMKECGGL